MSGFADFKRDPKLARAHSIQDQWLLLMRLAFNTIYVNIIYVYLGDWNTKGVRGLYCFLFAGDVAADSADDGQSIQLDGEGL